MSRPLPIQTPVEGPKALGSAGQISRTIAYYMSFLLWPDSPRALWVGAIGMGLSMASVLPVIMSLAERRITITGQTTGWFFFGASIGAMSLPWFMGQLFERISPLATMVAIFITVLAAIGVLVALLAYSGRYANELSQGPAPEC